MCMLQIRRAAEGVTFVIFPVSGVEVNPVIPPW